MGKVQVQLHSSCDLYIVLIFFARNNTHSQWWKDFRFRLGWNMNLRPGWGRKFSTVHTALTRMVMQVYTCTCDLAPRTRRSSKQMIHGSVSIVVSIPACHVGDLGSIPRRSGASHGRIWPDSVTNAPCFLHCIQTLLLGPYKKPLCTKFHQNQNRLQWLGAYHSIFENICALCLTCVLTEAWQHLGLGIISGSVQPILAWDLFLCRRTYTR